MIRRFDERKKEIKEKLKEGSGRVEFCHIAESEETYGKAKMYATLTLHKGDSIGYHSHTGEEEIMLINKGVGIYKEDNVEYKVKPGDITICQEGHFHSISNKNDEILEIIAIIIKKDA